MKDDPTIQAIREARHRISAAVGHDPHKLVEHYQKLQERFRDRMANPKPTSEPKSESAA